MRSRGRAALVVSLACLAPFAWRSARLLLQRSPEDFLYYYSGSSLYLQGGDPYDLPTYQRRLEARLGGPNPFPSKDFPFLYPPLMARLFGPVTKLPFVTAYGFWTGAVALSVLGCILLLARGADPATGLLLASFVLAYPGGEAALFMRRVTWPLLLALLAGLSLVGRRKDASAGLCLGLLAVQPQWYSAAALSLALGRKWKALAWSLAPTAASLLPYALGLRAPTELAHYAAGLASAGALVSRGSLSLANCAERLFDPRWTPAATFLPAPAWFRPLWLSTVGLAGAALAWIWSRTGRWESKAAWTFAAAVAVQPYSGSADTLWLLPWLVGGLKGRWPGKDLPLAALGALAATLALRLALGSTMGRGWIGLAYLGCGLASFGTKSFRTQ